VDVRRPAAVLLRRADPREGLAAADVLSDGKTAEAVQAEVAVQGEERLALGGVEKDHERPVVQLGLVVRHHVDHAVEGRVDLRARGSEEIDAEVDGAPLVDRGPAAEEH
jgi:hypothetical protein